MQEAIPVEGRKFIHVVNEVRMLNYNQAMEFENILREFNRRYAANDSKIEKYFKNKCGNEMALYEKVLNEARSEENKLKLQYVKSKLNKCLNIYWVKATDKHYSLQSVNQKIVYEERNIVNKCFIKAFEPKDIVECILSEGNKLTYDLTRDISEYYNAIGNYPL